MNRAHEQIATYGTLSIQVPPDGPALHLDDVQTLMAAGTEMMSQVCPGAGVQFMADPTGCDPHTIVGILTLHTPRTWGNVGIDAEHPDPMDDDEIRADINGFADEVLTEAWGETLAANSYQGATIGLGFRRPVQPGVLAGVVVSTPAPVPAATPALLVRPAAAAA